MRQAYFHEDDYCQVELVPAENAEWCRSEIAAIERFSEAHQAGVGWTDMYQRMEAPAALRDRKIPIDEFARALGDSLPRYDSVTSGYSSVVEPVPNTIAYGSDEGCTIYAGASDGYVSAVWLQVGPANEDDIRALHSLQSVAARARGLECGTRCASHR